MKIWTLSLIGLVAVSCSGGATTTREVQNSTSKEIKMLMYRGGSNYSDTITLAPGESKQFSVISYDQAEEEEDNCVRGLDSAYYEVEGGGTITKDISRNSSWEVESDKTKTIPPEYEHSCVFEILSTDIEE